MQSRFETRRLRLDLQRGAGDGYRWEPRAGACAAWSSRSPLPRGVCNQMTITRRRFAILAGAAAAALAAVRMARAQGYPARPVRLIVGFPAGGAADITARLIGQWLSERLGPPVFIPQPPGAGAHIRAATV